jgi:hypothetical protein
MVKPGSYLKRVAPQFGARFSTGDPDFNNLSMWQHWAQKCFVGGMDAPDFADDAMYDDGVGVDTSEHEKVTLSRDMLRGSGANWGVGGGSIPRRFFVWNDSLWLVTLPAAGTASELWKYVKGTDSWANIATVTDNCVKAVAVFDGKVFFGGRKLDNSAAKLQYGTTNALTGFTTVALPSGITSGAATALRTFQQKLYVSFSAQIWRLKDDLTWDGNTVFYKASATSDSNYMVAMEPHLGFLYMLSQNGHIHRTDGNSTFDIWNWDGQTRGVAMRSFDGRLFIATYEYTTTTDVGFAVLYQMSGSAVTQLKRWGKETEANTLGNLLVFDRKLFYGAGNLLGMRRGFGVAAYDPIEDAHSIIAANGDTATYGAGVAPYSDMLVDDVFVFGGQMFVSTRGHGIFRTPYQPRDYYRGLRSYDITAAGGAVGAQNGGWFTTSTYDAGTPGVRKLWRKIVVDYVIPSSACSIIVEYSTDGGTTYTALNAVSVANGATANTRERREYFLQNKIGVSLKLRITLRSTDGTKTPTFYGFVVSYLPIPEPNWLWTFTIPMTAKQELVDGTDETNDTEEEMGFLRDAYRTKQLLNFIDVDGSLWASGGQPGVLIYDIEFRIYNPSSKPLEGDIVVTLLEAVETY